MSRCASSGVINSIVVCKINSSSNTCSSSTHRWQCSVVVAETVATEGIATVSNIYSDFSSQARVPHCAYFWLVLAHTIGNLLTSHRVQYTAESQQQHAQQ
jgi:hypothetical protein